MKPMLKAPGTKCLNLKYGKPLSSFAFNANLRRYTTAGDLTLAPPILATKFAPLPLRWTANAVPDALKARPETNTGKPDQSPYSFHLST